MGRANIPAPAKLFMSVIAREEDPLEQGLRDLAREVGEFDFISEKFPFDFTGYYAPEMGENLFRHFITVKRLIPREALPVIKRTTNRLEERLSDPDGNRRVNIDPGYLCAAHVVLATTKAYAHRPYLAEGIYVDLTLIYRDRSFQPLGWTYPDYRQEEILRLFNRLRKNYLDQMKEGDDHS